MRGAFAVVVTLVLFLLIGGVAVSGAVAGPAASAAAQGSSELAGGWVITSRTSPSGEVNDSPGPGLYIFTESGHYSIMYVTQSEPRPVFADQQNPTDEEKLEAWGNFVANSGRYRVEGDVITHEAYMAKNPNLMAAFTPNAAEAGNARTLRFSIDDGILTLYFTGANAGQASITLRRPVG